MAEPVRILADYHHADLYESHCILFEDGLGWQVFRPTGMDWREAGYWRYSDDPAVVRQYLQPWPGQRLTADGAWYEAPEVAHPERVHKLVTFAQFQALRWNFLLASVTQHERLYCDLAGRVGAVPIIQVGNVGQPVDWTLPHVALSASSAVAIPPGRGLHYRPPFSLVDYRADDAAAPLWTGVSLMNCLPVSGAADDWAALRARVPEVRWYEHGILGRDGILGPSAAVAAKMRSAGIGFHVKPGGDGYGFVVHQWHAVGKPLVCRRSYYAGQTAASLLSGEHVLDLDTLGVDAVGSRCVELLSDREEYARLCAAARERFRDVVRFAAERDAIHALLGERAAL